MSLERINKNTHQRFDNFDFLVNRPQFIPTIAYWQYNMWGKYRKNDSVQMRKKEIETKLNIDKIPFISVGYSADVLLGSVDIVFNDLDSHKHLNPWLTNLYVSQKERRKGIGTALIQYSLSHLRVLGITKVFLYTWDRQQFYQKLGWSEIETSVFCSKKISIMRMLNDNLNNPKF